MKMTNKILILLMAAVFALTVSSCRKRSINGDLDGMWQVMSIEYADGTVVNPESTYYCLFLHTFNLQRPGNRIAGNMIYEGDELKLEAPYATASELNPWGMNNTVTTFRILRLTSGNMTLESDYAHLELRKF
ncbi:lipocalin-like domain-containing protein [Barnesiella sp. WM24]|uniref:lipocalin-like domain-containing protein n=1 Tax=Barnesiella sp. WM24 TaxID=2558278 RepID=UPI001430BDF7|nr:lipocalin-like domain-containing protein [Barnesiella sp. WM24]